MKKIVAILSGTNRTGKTTTANAILDLHGGALGEGRALVYSRDGEVAVIHADAVKGALQQVADMTNEALCVVPTVIAEGMYLGSTGMSTLNVLFTPQAELQLYVLLYASATDIVARRASRPAVRGGQKERGRF